MTNTDPFSDDIGHVVIPTPGKMPEPAASAPPEPEAPAPAMDDSFNVEDLTRGFALRSGEIPEMVAQAAPLLNLAHALRRKATPPDLATLRHDTIQAVKTYERALGSAGIVPEQARAAHYVVCATLDDVIRNTPWGGDWASEGLVSTFHHDVTGGDKVFELLAHFQASPGANRDLLLLIYLCISLGFEGRTRVSPRGGMELSQIRDNLYRTLRAQYGTFERDLSPAWQGEEARYQRLRSGRMFWAIAGVLVLALLGAFLLFSSLLRTRADATIAQMATLPPNAPPSLFIPEPAPEAEPIPAQEASPPPEEAETTPQPSSAPPVEERPQVNPIDTFMSFLQPEVEAGLVKLFRRGDAVLVRVANQGAFSPGGAEINPAFNDIFDRIGQALSAERFNVEILGHTDNRPIRSAPYPSNQHLSTARANAVRDLIVPYTGPERVEIRGLAASQPIATNTTAEGREANRRTEILVIRPGSRVDPALLEANRSATQTEAAE